MRILRTKIFGEKSEKAALLGTGAGLGTALVGRSLDNAKYRHDVKKIRAAETKANAYEKAVERAGNYQAAERYAKADEGLLDRVFKKGKKKYLEEVGENKAFKKEGVKANAGKALEALEKAKKNKKLRLAGIGLASLGTGYGVYKKANK